MVSDLGREIWAEMKRNTVTGGQQSLVMVPGQTVPPLSQSSLVHSHWSRNDEARLSLVERFIVLLWQLSYAIKNQLGHPKPPTRGFGTQNTLWHKDRWLPCTERSYYRRPYAIKNQRGASKDPLGLCVPNNRGLWMPELVLYGIRELAPAIPRI